MENNFINLHVYYLQQFGQIWIIQSRATIFQSLDLNFLFATLSDHTLLQSVMSQNNCLKWHCSCTQNSQILLMDLLLTLYF